MKLAFYSKLSFDFSQQTAPPTYYERPVFKNAQRLSPREAWMKKGTSPIK